MSLKLYMCFNDNIRVRHINGSQNTTIFIIIYYFMVTCFGPGILYIHIEVYCYYSVPNRKEFQLWPKKLDSLGSVRWRS